MCMCVRICRPSSVCEIVGSLVRSIGHSIYRLIKKKLTELSDSFDATEWSICLISIVDMQLLHHIYFHTCNSHALIFAILYIFFNTLLTFSYDFLNV